jgi:ribosome maturation factor RimP
MKEKLLKLLEELLAGREIEVVEVMYVTGGRRPLARIFVDKQGGVSVNECGKIAKELAVLTHVDDTFPEDLIFEVSSPGIDRPLKTEADFRRNTGRRIKVTVLVDNKERDTEGVILKSTGGGIVLSTATGEVSFDINSIIRAKQVIKF